MTVSDSQHIRLMLEKIDDFPHEVTIIWALVVGEDNKFQTEYGEVISNTKAGVLNNSLNVASIILALSDIKGEINGAIGNSNMMGISEVHAVKREIRSLMYLKTKIEDAISDLNKPNPSFNWIY